MEKKNKTKVVSFRLNKEEIEKLNSICNKDYRNKANVLKMAFLKFIEKEANNG